MADSTRKPEWTDKQAAEFALFDASRDPKEFLPEIYREPSNAAQDPDARISKTLAKCSALFVKLSEEQATLAHRIDCYTRWLIVLTVMLVHAYKVRPRKGRRGLEQALAFKTSYRRPSSNPTFRHR